MNSPSADLNTHIDELQSLLDRLAHQVRAIEEPEEPIVVPPTEIPAPIDSTSTTPAQGRRVDLTPIDYLRSWIVGPFRRCAYCAQWGARLEPVRAGVRWQCRCCRHRSRVYARKRTPKH
jgi:hypothetical protein